MSRVRIDFLPITSVAEPEWGCLVGARAEIITLRKVSFKSVYIIFTTTSHLLRADLLLVLKNKKIIKKNKNGVLKVRLIVSLKFAKSRCHFIF